MGASKGAPIAPTANQSSCCQFVFTIPKVLRGIFRKRRHLLTLLFHTATSTLQDAFRIRLGLPHGRIGAIAGVHTSQEKITWNATSKTVIYRSKRHHTTKRNPSTPLGALSLSKGFEIFKAHDFIAAAPLGGRSPLAKTPPHPTQRTANRPLL